MPAKPIVPLIVAVALFMENMDSTVIATSLPAIAAGHLLLALARGLHSGERLDRRPFRRAHGVSGSDRRVHARLDRLRALGLALRIRGRTHRRGHGRGDDDARGAPYSRAQRRPA